LRKKRTTDGRERENGKTIYEKKGKQKIIKNTKQAGYWVRKVRK
jgi:hypothetical protein